MKHGRKTQAAIAGFKDGGKSHGQRNTLEAGEDEKVDFPPEPPRKNEALLTSLF